MMQALLMGAALVPLSIGAYGQAPAASNEGGIETVIVTAEKHTENVQKAAMQLQVLSGEDLRSQTIASASDLARLVPDIGVVTDTVHTKIAIRGVLAESVAESVDQAVVVNVDGEYMSRPDTLANTMFDLERIEVLKGPQGTLYGRNATAGTLNVVTAKPGPDFGGYVTVGAGNFGAYNVEAAVNIPVTDEFSLRFSGMHTQHTGYTKLYYVPDTNVANESALRASAALDLTRFKAFLSVEYDNTNDRPALTQWGFQVTSSTPGMVLTSDGVNSDYLPLGNFGITLPKRGFPIHPDLSTDAGYTHDNALHIRTKLDYDLGDGFDLAYVGGLFDMHTSSLIRLAGMEIPPPFTDFNSYVPYQDMRDWSNELHLSYTGENGLFAQIGAFYFDEDQKSSNSIQTVVPPNFFFPGANGNLFIVNNFHRPGITERSYAFFGQADIPVTDTIKITGGLRYTNDLRKGMYLNGAGSYLLGGFASGDVNEADLPGSKDILANFAADPTPLPTVCGHSTTDSVGDTIIKQCYHKDKVNWLVGVNWSPTDNNMVYGKISTAFRAGGFDNLSQTIFNGHLVGNFLPETVISYEVGTKNRFLDNALQVNLAGFMYDYTDLQVDSFVNVTVGHYTTNAGKARFRGIDFDAQWQFTDQDRVGVVGTYLDATYTSYKTVEAGVNGIVVNVDLAGNKPPDAPQWSYKVNYEHNFNLGTYGALTFDASTQFKSNYFVNSYDYSLAHQESYFQSDLSLTYAPTENYNVQLFVHNLEDYVPITYMSWTGGPPINIVNFAFGQPRTWGVQGNVKF